jgi:hypothetical protein
MVSRFPDGHALIAEVRRLQQENAVLCNGGELQRCVVNAAYEDKCKAEQQRDAALAAEQAANTRLATERRRTTEARTQNTWEQAQQILDRIGYDPDAATHRAELLAAFHPKETRS